MIGVLIVDDHEVVRWGLRAYLEEQPKVRCVGEAVDGATALSELERLAGVGQLPEVVLMDLVMPGEDGVTATRIIRQRFPSVQVVALTSFGESQRIKAAMAAGAVGYVMKDSAVDEIILAIESAAGGRQHMDALAEDALAQDRFAETLTVREREVLQLVAQGLSNRLVARMLTLSERTVQAHLTSIMRKLGLGSRTEAALWAVRVGLQDLD